MLLKSLTVHSSTAEVWRVTDPIEDGDAHIDEVSLSCVIEACPRIKRPPSFGARESKVTSATLCRAMDIEGDKTLSLDDFTGSCHACSRSDGLGSRWHAVGQKRTETVQREDLLFIHFEDSHAFRTMILMSVLIP